MLLKNIFLQDIAALRSTPLLGYEIESFSEVSIIFWKCEHLCSLHAHKMTILIIYYPGVWRNWCFTAVSVDPPWTSTHHILCWYSRIYWKVIKFDIGSFLLFVLIKCIPFTLLFFFIIIIPTKCLTEWFCSYPFISNLVFLISSFKNILTWETSIINYMKVSINIYIFFHFKRKNNLQDYKKNHLFSFSYFKSE